jgi:single-stranded DNA-binding protein
MNIVALTGRLVTLPEVKTSLGGKQYANASMVVQDATDKYPMFVDIVVFERNLQALQGTKKGGFIQVQGKLNIYNPKDQAGQPRSGKQIKVIVDSIIIPAERMPISTPETGNTGSYQPRPGGNGQTGASPVAVAAPPETDFDPFEE